MQGAARVLVVDAESFFRDAIRDALGDASIECEAVADGAEALKAAENPNVGAVVLDLRLDGMEALEVLRRLRQARPALGVVVLSASSDQEAVLEALRLGACDYLAKPLHDEELVLSVRRAVAAHRIESSWDSLRDRLHRLRESMADLADWLPEPGAEVAGLADRIARATGEILGAAKTSVMLLDDAGEVLRVEGVTGSLMPPDEMDPVPMGGGVAGLAVENGEPIVANDIRSDVRFAGRVPRERYESASFAVVPFEGAGVVGALCATDRKDGTAFAEEDLVLLRILALQAGPLLSTRGAEPSEFAVAGGPAAAGAPAREAGGAGDAELARAVCDAMTSEVEPSRVLEAALRPVARGIPAAPGALYLMDPASGELALEAQHAGSGAGDRPRLPRDRGLSATVLQTGRLVATDHPETDPRFDPDVDTPVGGALGPFLCAPLRLRGKVMGLVRAFPAVAASPRTGEVLAASLSAAVRNVLLYRSLLESIDEVVKARQRREQAANR